MSPLLTLLRDPGRMADLGTEDWDLLLRQARISRLTGHLGYLAAQSMPAAALPHGARDRFTAVDVQLAHINQQAWHQIRLLRKLLPADIPLLLLKGCAYQGIDLPHAQARQLSDVDLLLPATRLQEAEDVLRAAGWRSGKTNAYDQRYYREWMHEIPPLVHPDHDLELDLHHQILPPSGRLHPPIDKLWEQAQQIGAGLYTLAPADMLLHCAVHLMQDGDLQNGLRDLLDLDLMLRHFSADSDFAPTLAARARELGLSRPLGHCLYCCEQLLASPLAQPLDQLKQQFGGPSGTLVRKLAMRVLAPGDPTRPAAPLSAWLLYVRSHWLRMPPLLLGAHLLRKAWRRRKRQP